MQLQGPMLVVMRVLEYDCFAHTHTKQSCFSMKSVHGPADQMKSYLCGEAEARAVVG